MYVINIGITDMFDVFCIEYKNYEIWSMEFSDLKSRDIGYDGRYYIWS